MTTRGVLSVAAMMFGGVLWSAGDARACAHAIRMESPALVQLEEAEELLDAGNLEDAASLALASRRQLPPRLLARADLVLWAATVRSQGRLGPAGVERGDTKARERILASAEKALRRLVRSNSETVRYYAIQLHAEALAQRASTRKRGIEKLETLATEDALAPEGWALLATARRDAGDLAGADVALTTCVERASSADRQCPSLAKDDLVAAK